MIINGVLFVVEQVHLISDLYLNFLIMYDYVIDDFWVIKELYGRFK